MQYQNMFSIEAVYVSMLSHAPVLLAVLLPVRALALPPTVPRAGAAGGAERAPPEALPPAPRRRRHGHAGGRNPACAAATPAQHRERLRVSGVVVGAKARNVERSGPHGVAAQVAFESNH